MEGEIFDPDAFLDELAQQWKQDPSNTPQTSTEPFMNPQPPTRSDTQILYSCPRHPNDTLEKKETNTPYGYWGYYKCPVRNCYVSCGVNDIEYCLDSAKHKLHKFFLSKPVHIMECYCHRPLIMSLSQSEKNPGRLFLKCPKRSVGGSRTPRQNQSLVGRGQNPRRVSKAPRVVYTSAKRLPEVESVCREMELLKNENTSFHC